MLKPKRTAAEQVEEVNETDPALWRRKRGYKPWPENDPRKKRNLTPRA